MFADRVRRTERDLREVEARGGAMEAIFGARAAADELCVRGAEILTLDRAGDFVLYRGLSIEEIEGYGFVGSVPKRRVVGEEASDSEASSEAPLDRQGYQEYLRARQARFEAGWDPDDPDPENPWNQ